MAESKPSELTYPEDSDIQEGAIRVSSPKPAAPRHEDYTADGNYIPSAGGTRGWFENSAVLDVEEPNNYLFREAVDAEAFRKSSIDRIQDTHRRAAKRFAASMPVRVKEDGSDEEEQPGFCVDVSMTGTRLRVRANYEPGTRLVITFCTARSDHGGAEPLFPVVGIVRWTSVATVARGTVRYFAGIQFEPVDLPTKEALAKLLN